MEEDEEQKTDEIKAVFDRSAHFMKELLAENSRMRKKLGEIEAENQHFAQRYIEIETHNEMLQNLYVTSHRLHATLEPNDVLTTIREILINLVGGETFGIWLLDSESGKMSLLSQEGLSENSELLPEELSRSATVMKSDAWYDDRPGARTLAMVPLRVDDRAVGIIVIRSIFGHKAGLTHLDRQILGLLSGQAATALTSARLHAEKSRKLETMKAFVDFIKMKG